jgi:capsular exopolysaccharide synthesis family protein
VHPQFSRKFSLERDSAHHALEFVWIIQFLRRRWLIVASVVILCLVAGAAVAYMTQKSYTAIAHILFTPPREKTIGSEGSLLQSPLDAAALESQISLILSSILLQQVVEGEGLAQDPEFVGRPAGSILARLRSYFETPGTGAVTPESEVGQAIMALRQRLAVSRVANSYGVTISMTSEDPAKAARLANAVANSYISDRLSTRLGDSQRSVRLINPANVPLSPSQPRLLPILVSALCGGLFLGLAIAYLAEVFTFGFVTPQQIETVLGIPVLAMLAKLTPNDCNDLGDKVDAASLLIVKPSARFSESVRGLRNLLQMRMQERRTKVVQVTSTIPDEGKTTVAMCLATSAAASGQNVIIVDCDIRRAKLTSYFKLGNSTGLVDLLEGTATLEETIRFDQKYGVRVLPVGRVTDDPPGLLGTATMKEVLARLGEQFDFVVIDTPPIDPVVDALMIANSVDNVLIVVRWNHTPRSVVKRAVRMVLDENENMGVVLNYINPRRAIAYDREAYTRFDSNLYQSYYQ